MQLAVRHARQSPSKQLDCLLIGSAWITEGMPTNPGTTPPVISLLLVYSPVTVAHQCQVLSMVYSAGEGVAIDVDRFDPGRPGKPGDGVVPTAVIPGDIAIPCQVW